MKELLWAMVKVLVSTVNHLLVCACACALQVRVQMADLCGFA